MLFSAPMYRRCVFAAFFAFGCQKLAPPIATNPAVEPASADPIASEADPEPESDEAANAPFFGVVLVGDTVDLAPKTDGRLESIRVKPGQRVKRGEILAQLDRRMLRQSLSVAEAQLVLAEERFNRRVPLAKGEGTISKEELSTTKMQMLDQRARVNELRHALSEADIRAPFDGMVASRFYDPGALTPAGRPILRVISASVPRVRFALPEAQAGALAVGRQVSVLVEGVKEPFSAEVESVSPEIDTAARMVFALARLEVPEARRDSLRSGQVAHVKAVIAGEARGVEAKHELPPARVARPRHGSARLRRRSQTTTAPLGRAAR
jgi:RND family efflux transporter MFP subunit